jgi:hypothetical protein
LVCLQSGAQLLTGLKGNYLPDVQIVSGGLLIAVGERFYLPWWHILETGLSYKMEGVPERLSSSVALLICADQSVYEPQPAPA